MPTSNNLIPLAKKLRTEQSPWEQKLWYYLRANRFQGLKFKRQVVIHKYIVDFCCNQKKLIIELDGGQHKENKNVVADKVRDKYFESQGYKILRFNNNDLDNNIEGVLEIIRLKVK